MANIYKNAEGKKLYPVCGFQSGQHKISYWYTKAQNRWFEEKSTEALEDLERKEKWMECATTYIYDGLIYAPYELYNEMKEAVVCYDLRH